ncbi:MAG: hypothetical protein ABIJ17_02425 [Patescibacteria group bacterium]
MEDFIFSLETKVELLIDFLKKNKIKISHIEIIKDFMTEKELRLWVKGIDIPFVLHASYDRSSIIKIYKGVIIKYLKL